ncbi:MAG: recombinase family protein, partial [Phycisphaerales bacterium]|nr:recombinase family protein [Phycisphaerales bacterium]
GPEDHRGEVVGAALLRSGWPMKRCAIYTRKSTEEGLEQYFNSLQAQREACEAYIKSQMHEGWKPLKTKFDDGGYSGGNMDRPGLQALMEAVEQRLVDVIVVYKVDRLTRSLADFAKIVERLDAQDVSFVSVTQQFNTTSSMGRLTLNVLLSFAQFEREVTAERIRDKISASKKKGMWMGGPVPLGYDARDRKLIVNEVEAETVQTIFRLYLELGSVRLLKRTCDERGIVSKIRKYEGGRVVGGAPLSRGNLYHMLSNPIYAGFIPHRGERYPGQHDAIIDAETWGAVQKQLSDNAVVRRTGSNAKSASLLKGLIFDETGDVLSPSHAAKNGRRYRYYVSHRAIDDADAHPDAWRARAEELEALVIDILCRELEAPQSGFDEGTSERVERLRIGSFEERFAEVQELVDRVDLSSDKIVVRVKAPDDQAQEIVHPVKLKRRGVERKIVIPGLGGHAAEPDPLLCSLVAKPLIWIERLTSETPPTLSEIANDDGMSVSDVSRTLQLVFLAPDIVEAILAGRQPVDLTAQKLKRLRELPTEWPAQRQLLGFNAIT